LTRRRQAGRRPGAANQAQSGVPVEFLCFDAARESYGAMAAGRADICFLAVEPAREAEVALTAPYVVIEGVFAVPEGSDITGVGVDRPGVRIGVKAMRPDETTRPAWAGSVRRGPAWARRPAPSPGT
jgi:hypothetical protein